MIENQGYAIIIGSTQFCERANGQFLSLWRFSIVIPKHF